MAIGAGASVIEIRLVPRHDLLTVDPFRCYRSRRNFFFILDAIILDARNDGNDRSRDRDPWRPAEVPSAFESRSRSRDTALSSGGTGKPWSPLNSAVQSPRGVFRGAFLFDPPPAKRRSLPARIEAITQCA